MLKYTSIFHDEQDRENKHVQVVKQNPSLPIQDIPPFNLLISPQMN